MAIRDIVWTVAEDAASITPSTIQNGGVQGEHNATRAIFQIGESSPLANPEYTLYVECTDSTGGEPDHQGPLTIENGQVSVLLPLAWTQYGGVSTMRLVAEKTATQSEKVITLECRVRFDTRPAGPKGDSVMRGFMQAMLNETVEAKEAAEEAAQNAEAAESDAFLNRDAAVESALEARGLAADALLNAQRAADRALAAGAASEAAAASAAEAAAQKGLADSAAAAAQAAAEAAREAAENMAEITIDTALDPNSTNPVQNQAVARQISTLGYNQYQMGERVTRIENDIADLKYVAIDITSITNNVGTVEMGRTINSVTITWALNKAAVSQTVDGNSVDASARSHTLSGLAITSGKTYTVTATDERGATDTASTSIVFYNGVYHGVMADGATINSAAILGLTRKLQGSKATTFTANAGAGQRIVYALPTRYGTPNFNVGGFDGGFSKATTISFTNASGYTENYDVWVSDNAGLGNTTVKVS